MPPSCGRRGLLCPGVSCDFTRGGGLGVARPGLRQREQLDCCPDHKPVSSVCLLSPISSVSIPMGPDLCLFKSHEIKRCLLLGRKVMTNLHSIFKSRDITLPTTVHLVKAMVFPVVMYGFESWTVKKAECRRIDAF